MRLYVCFIEHRISATPHMEPLAAQDDAAAMAEGTAILRRFEGGIAVHVLDGDRRVGTVRADAGDG